MEHPPPSGAPLAPGLYVVATPLGNARDITLRALDVLHGVDIIYCEDTRVTGKLAALYAIKTQRRAYHEHNAAAMRPKILEELAAGKTGTGERRRHTADFRPRPTAHPCRARGRSRRVCRAGSVRPNCRSERFGPSDRSLHFCRVFAGQIRAAASGAGRYRRARKAHWYCSKLRADFPPFWLTLSTGLVTARSQSHAN